MSNQKIHHIQNQYFIEIPITILEVLDPYEFYIYSFLKNECYKKGSCTLSFQKISKITKTSQEKTRNVLKTLSNNIYKNFDEPLIFIKRRYTEDGGNDTNEIFLNDKLLF